MLIENTNFSRDRTEGVESYDLASEAIDKPRVVKLLEYKELLAFLNQVAGAQADALIKSRDQSARHEIVSGVASKLTADQLAKLFQNGLELLERIDSKRLLGTDMELKIKLWNAQAQYAEQTAKSLNMLDEQSAELFEKPAAFIISLFTAEALARLQRFNLSNLEAAEDVIDQARISFIIATGVGLKDDDTAIGVSFLNESKTSAAAQEEDKTQVAVEESAEQRIAKKKERLLKGSAKEVPAENGEDPQSVAKTANEPSEIDLIVQSETDSRRTRVATSRERAQILKKALGNIKNISLPNDTNIKEALARSVMSSTELREHISDKELLLRLRRERIYSFASVLKSWFQYELQLLTLSSNELPELKHFCVDKDKAVERSEKVSKTVNQRNLFQEIATIHISEVIEVIGKRLIEIRAGASADKIELSPEAEEELQKLTEPEIRIIAPSQQISMGAYFRDKQRLRARQKEIEEDKNKPWLKLEREKKKRLL